MASPNVLRSLLINPPLSLYFFAVTYLFNEEETVLLQQWHSTLITS